MTTFLYTHEVHDEHITPSGHPEQIARLHAIKKALNVPKFNGLLRKDCPLGGRELAELVHPSRYIQHLEAHLPNEGLTYLDGDTVLSPKSLDAAFHALGAGADAVDRVMGGTAKNAFIAARPPGHHAEKTTAMGFCLFGTVAMIAKYALLRDDVSRVAILDFDVHHGNGTEDLVKDDKDILFISSHQMPLYPGTGHPTYKGPFDTITNIALPAHSDGDYMKEIYKAHVFDKIAHFNPDLIVLSAGFDAHLADPLAQLNWSTEDFGWMSSKIMDVARDICKGRVISSLEGGYNLEALAASVALHLEILLKEAQD